MTPSRTEAAMREALTAVAAHGSIKAAADATGIPRKTMSDRYHAGVAAGVTFDKPRVRVKAGGVPDFELPELPSEYEPVEELIERRKKAFLRLQTAKEARDLIPVKVNIDGPYGVLHFGDPHVDDNGCDWNALEHHITLIDKTPGLFAGNIGDSANFWIGRLARLYGNQSVTAAEAVRMVEWFIGRLRWIFIIGGNHDVWNGATDPVRWFAAQSQGVYEWHGVRLALQSPNGREIRINARHDFAGTSMWNGAHAPAKAARMGWARDHVYTCGHRHSAAYNMLVFNNGEHIAHAIRVGTFKVYDDFAEAKGFPKENMPSALTVMNPDAKTAAGLVTVFWDVDEGAEYLRYLRRDL